MERSKVVLLAAAALASFIIVSGAVKGQDRTYGAAMLAYKDAVLGDNGMLSVDDGSSVLEWRLLYGGFSDGPVETVMPFALVGGLTNAGGRHFVASGVRSDGQGVLVRFTLSHPWISSPQITVDEESILGEGVDPQSVYWSHEDEALFVLDGKGDQVLCAPYTGSGAALPSLGTYVKASDIGSDFGPAVHLKRPLNNEPTGVAVFSKNSPDQYIYVWHDGVSWRTSVKILPVPVPVGSGQWLVANARYWAVGNQLEISGVAGPYVLMDESSGLVVETGSTESASELYEVTLPASGLVPGIYYSISSPPSQQGSPLTRSVFLPHVRYGVPVDADEVRMPYGYCGQIVQGNSEFALHDCVRPHGSLAQEVDVDVYLWVAFRDTQGEDPVVPAGGDAYTIDPNKLAGVLGPIRVSVKAFPYPVYEFDMPVPADENIVGNTMFFQCAAEVAQTSHVAISDVFGVNIIAPEFAGLTVGGQQGQAAMSSGALNHTPTKEMLRAAQAWLGSGATSLSRSRRDRVIELQTQLRNQ